MQRLDQWNELYVCMYIHSPIPIPQKHGTQIVPKILHWRLVCFGVYDADSCANPQTIMWAYTGRTVISVQCNIGIMNWGLLHVVGKKPVFTFHKSYDDFDSLQMLLPWMGNVGIYFITNLNLRQLTLGWVGNPCIFLSNNCWLCLDVLKLVMREVVPCINIPLHNSFQKQLHGTVFLKSSSMWCHVVW